ncbi:hypothetical protein J6590_070751 [Homalodisca vitripennis]|nr:hypothetical protein J6590_070751 [Homalodisca vitripennis]
MEGNMIGYNKVGSFTPFNNESDVKEFVTHSSENEFRHRFPEYHGAKENFDYSLYAKEVFEAKLNLRCVISEVYTTRQCRRAYKIGLAQQQRKWAEAMSSMVEPTYHLGSENCYRCMLIEQGNVLISDFAISSCSIAAPREGVIKEEQLRRDEHIDHPSDQAYQLTMAASTTFSSTETDFAICNDEPIKKIVEGNCLTLLKKFEPVNPKHKCIASNKRIKNENVALELLSEGCTQAEHKLVYAPPAFGKTTLQHAAMRRGVAMLETDDTPGTTNSVLESMLRKTTVLTNRLDLVRQSSVPVIFFTTSSWEKLKERANLLDINDEGWKNLWQTTEEEAKRGLKCVSDTKFITDWFKWQDKPPVVLGAWAKAETTPSQHKPE